MVGGDDFAAGGAGDCFAECGRVGVAVGEVDKDDAARRGEVVGLERLSAGVEAHMAFDDAHALRFGHLAPADVLGQQGGVVVAFKEPRADAGKGVGQQARIGGKDHGAYLGVRDEEPEWLGGVVAHIEGEHLEAAHTEGARRAHGVHKGRLLHGLGQGAEGALGGVERQGGFDVLRGVAGVVGVLVGEQDAADAPEVEPEGTLQVVERAAAF